MSSSLVPKFAHVTNRLWRRKHLIFIAIILISLIITVSYTVNIVEKYLQLIVKCLLFRAPVFQSYLLCHYFQINTDDQVLQLHRRSRQNNTGGTSEKLNLSMQILILGSTSVGVENMT